VAHPQPAGELGCWETFPLSNANLVSRLKDACLAYESGRLSLRNLASAVEFQIGAFEALSFADYKSLQSIARELNIEAHYAEEGCEFEAAAGRSIEELRVLLSRIAV
jgi:hypothetical protein